MMRRHLRGIAPALLVPAVALFAVTMLRAVAAEPAGKSTPAVADAPTTAEIHLIVRFTAQATGFQSAD